MLWSKTFIPTLKETPQEAESVSHKLLLRAGFIRMLMAGVYTYLPLGLRVLSNIQAIIRQEMNSCGASELLLPAMQPLELWQRSGRDKDIGEVMIRFTDRRGRKVCLGPTHEEVITDLIRTHISSYKQLPLLLYQIQTKFRDEIRPRFGLIRACEFIMKDAYSFDRDTRGLEKSYKAMFEAYKRIFKRCGLNFLITEAPPGVMGGNISHEFMLPAQDGEDIVLSCPKCKSVKAFAEGLSQNCAKCNAEMDKINTIEVAHIFQLGVKYSSVLGANFLNDSGRLSPIVMGCYGIGVSRLVSSIIEQNYDANGIIWPKEVSPYQAVVLPRDVAEIKVMDLALEAYNRLEEAGISVLLDDREQRLGVKFKDADLLGIPLQVIIGKEAMENNALELKKRGDQGKMIRPKEEIFQEIEKFLNIV